MADEERYLFAIAHTLVTIVVTIVVGYGAFVVGQNCPCLWADPPVIHPVESRVAAPPRRRHDESATTAVATARTRATRLTVAVAR